MATRPATLAEPPPGLFERFGASADAARINAATLLTVGAEGWPHAALLAPAEVASTGPRTLRLLLWPHSTTAANLVARGQALLTLPHEGGVVDIRLRISDHAPTEDGNILFEADIGGVRHHRAPYATVTSGVTFELDAEFAEATRARWRQQQDTLRRP